MTPSKPILAPMLASIGDAPIADQRMAYEPKYDGIRAIVEVHAANPDGTAAGVGAPAANHSRPGR